MSVFDKNLQQNDEPEISDPYEEQPDYEEESNEEVEVDESTNEEDFDGDYTDSSDSDPTPDPFAKFESKLEEISSKYEQRIAQLEAQLEKVGEKDANMELANFDAAIARLKNERREALSIGDMDAFDAADEQLDEVKSKRAELDLQLKQKPQPKAAPAPAFVAWQKKNPWYGTNREMTQVALAYGQVAEMENPGKTHAELLQIVDRKMRAKYPKAFQLDQTMNKTGNAGTKQKPAGKSYADLPRDAKMACDEWVSEGKMTREQYVKSYFEQ